MLSLSSKCRDRIPQIENIHARNSRPRRMANRRRYDRSILILYGSETGNSHDAAEDLGRMTERLHFVTRVCPMDHVEFQILHHYTVVLFTVATTGQGEFPKNSRRFWKSLLRKRLPPDYLSHVSFTTFGLGDSSYPKFNWSARKLHKRLEQLGATETYPRGEADEQHDEGIDGTFLPWSLDLQKHLLFAYPLPEGVTPIPSDQLLPPKYEIDLVENIPQSPYDSFVPEQRRLSAGGKPSAFNEPEMDLPTPDFELPVHCPQLKDDTTKEQIVRYQMETAYEDRPDEELLDIPGAGIVQLIDNKRLTPESHWQDVRELTFIAHEEAMYDPGDTMTIYPKNFPIDVQLLIDLMEWNEVADVKIGFLSKSKTYFDAEVHMEMPAGMHPPAKRCTLRQLLTHNMDITAIPKRYFFEMIAAYTNDSTHKERLLEFANPIYSDEYFDYTTRPRRSILEVLADFPTVKLPWKYATSLFPIIRGRAYSISSGGFHKQYHRPNLIKIQLLVAIVKYRTVLKKIRQGLASRYLATLPKRSEIRVTFGIEDGFNRISRLDPSVPSIMIAPGTGLAPCRSLIWQRAAQRMENVNVGETLLIYGGRNMDADFFYREEWNTKILNTTVLTAFSRDQKHKIYVQDIVRNESDRIIDLLMNKNAVIYVCGSSGAMPRLVRAALIDTALEWKKARGTAITREAMEKYFEDLEKAGHYVQETW